MIRGPRLSNAAGEIKGRVVEHPRVPLAEFVERFDRTFLPVAEVRVR